jgi:hypothetical protein
MSLNHDAAQWWAGQLMIADKRWHFANALQRRLDHIDGDWTLYVDYDPDDTLLDVLRAVGIECRGCFFSADGIFPFTKTGMKREGQQLFLKRGYGAGWDALTPPSPPAAPPAASPPPAKPRKTAAASPAPSPAADPSR